MGENRTRLQAIAEFLKGERHRVKEIVHVNLDEHVNNLELQVNVHPGEEVVKGVTKSGRRWSGWKGNGYIFKHFRIPYSPNSNPQYPDNSSQPFPLSKHVKGIGFTGWDWRNKQSLYVGFDVDSVLNHKQGLSYAEIQRVIETLAPLDWVEIRRSKSGKGIHVYVAFDRPVPTATHTEHAGLARYILGIISTTLSFDFSKALDVCGSVFWVWHAEADVVHGGYTLLKKGNPYNSSSIPSSWKEHIERLSGKKKAKTPDMEELLRKIRHAPLDEEHRRLIDYFSTIETTWWWDPDYNMLVCHTKDLEDAHRTLNLRGQFHTRATGQDRPADQNCFGFPGKKGTWTFRRHGKGTPEHPYWFRDRSGWTTCYYNKLPTLATAARSHGAIRDAKGNFHVKNCKDIERILADLGTEIEIPFSSREGFIKKGGDRNELVIEIKRIIEVDGSPEEWFPKNTKTWQKVVIVNIEEEEIEVPDERLRHCVKADSDAGFFFCVNNIWYQEPRSNITAALVADGLNRGIAELLIGTSILNPWILEKIPFQEEYPGGRIWNLDSPQFAVDPRPGSWDTWQELLSHLGKNIPPSEWCLENDIYTGDEYLLYWIAALFQFPDEPLPYLFFHGGQNTGKSTFHEALRLLFKGGNGYVRADNALTNTSRFNGELEGAVLCVVEETDLQRSKEAYNRIKDWVTAKSLSIQAKYSTPYEADNYTHWVQCSNDWSACPIFAGDSRITGISVSAIQNEIPKERLLEQLRSESPAFLHHILKLDVPNAPGRLRIPIIETDLKTQAIDINMNPVERFIQEKMTPADGYLVYFSEFFERFTQWLDTSEHGHWSSRKVAVNWPSHVTKARWYKDNHISIGNYKWISHLTEQMSQQKLILDGDRLRDKM